MKNPRSIAALLAIAIAAGSTAAEATQITYDFTTANITQKVGVATGFSPLASATGWFVYDTEAPYMGQGNAGTASVYQGIISEFHASIFDPIGNKTYTLYDQRGIGAVANDLFNTADPTQPGGFRPVVGQDLIELYVGPSYGNWDGFSLNGSNVRYAILTWGESPPPPANQPPPTFLIPDFLNDESIPPSLPTFDGSFLVSFGPDLTTSTGFAGFNHLKVTARPVPEPATAFLFALGALGMVAANPGRKRR